jgi:hypothetical protein
VAVAAFTTPFLFIFPACLPGLTGISRNASWPFPAPISTIRVAFHQSYPHQVSQAFEYSDSKDHAQPTIFFCQ